MWKPLFIPILAIALQADEIVTIAGTGQPGLSPTQINNPYGLTIGPDGALYFGEIGNHIIRRLDLKTRELTVFAGTGEKGNSGDDGPAIKALMDEPYDLRFDRMGNLFFADMTNNIVRRIDAKTKIVTTAMKDLNQPHCLAFDVLGALLVCDIGNQRIQRLDPVNGYVTTFLKQTFNGPRSLETDPGGELYLALRDGNAIGKLRDKFTPFVTVPSPKSISYAPDYSMYVADSDHFKILNVNMVTNAVSTAVGTGVRGDGPDGDPLQCKLARPHGVLAAADGRIFIADSENHRIRMLVYSSYGRPR